MPRRKPAPLAPVGVPDPRVGVAKVSLFLLADLLHLPPGHVIHAAAVNSADPTVLDLLIEGPTLPPVPAAGAAPARVRLVATTYLGAPEPRKTVVTRFEPI